MEVPSFIREFKERLKTISKELSDLENFLRENGVNVPEENITLTPYEKIWIPSGYIRTVSYYTEKYKLYKLIEDEIIVKNIAYSLQTSDFFNYILNRFRIELSVKKVFYKYAIINIFSIIEAILYGIVKKCHSFCIDKNGKVCKKSTRCQFYLKKPNKYSFRNLLEVLSSKNLLKMPPRIQDKVLKMEELRDNIHLWDVKYKEYFNKEYELKNYNFLVKCLQVLKEDLNDSLPKFEEKRKKFCKK